MNHSVNYVDPDMVPMSERMRLELLQGDLDEFDAHFLSFYRVLETEIEERKKSDEKIHKTAKRWNIISTAIASASLLVAIATLVFSFLKAA